MPPRALPTAVPPTATSRCLKRAKGEVRITFPPRWKIIIKMNLPEVLKQQVNGIACVCVCVCVCVCSVASGVYDSATLLTIARQASGG